MTCIKYLQLRRKKIRNIRYEAKETVIHLISFASNPYTSQRRKKKDKQMFCSDGFFHVIMHTSFLASHLSSC